MLVQCIARMAPVLQERRPIERYAEGIEVEFFDQGQVFLVARIKFTGLIGGSIVRYTTGFLSPAGPVGEPLLNFFGMPLDLKMRSGRPPEKALGEGQRLVVGKLARGTCGDSDNPPSSKTVSLTTRLPLPRAD